MENSTIYSHKLDFAGIAEIVKQKLPKANIEIKEDGINKSLEATIKGGLFGKSKKLRINYRERENPSYQLQQIECPLTQNLAGMVNYIQSLPTSNQEVKGKFLYKVMAVNSEMGFLVEPGFNDDFLSILKQIVTAQDAFLFAESNSVFKKSNGQHFLDKHFNLILDTEGNCGISDIEVSVDAKYHDSQQEDSEEQLKRKEKSESLLNEKGIKINANLPSIPALDDTQIRDLQSVIDRAYALMIIAARGEGVPVDRLQKPIDDKKINSFTPAEQRILSQEELSDQDRSYATWRYESLYTLLWVLNILPDLKYPSEICNVEEVVSSILQPGREEFEQGCKLRSGDEILDELDKTYRMNWACVDARINNQQVGGGIEPSIIYERHYALNWLTNYQNQEWDDVQTNT